MRNLADIVHELTDTALETKRLASEIEKKWAKTAGSPLKELKDKIIRMLVKNSRGQMMIGGQDISKKIHKAETTESLKVVFDEIIESIDKANKPGSEWTQIRINELKEFSARLLILHKLEMIGGDLKAQLNVLSAVIKKLPSLKENEIKPTLDALFKLNKAFTNNIENREKDIAVSLNKFGSPLTMEQAKKSGIQRIAMIKDLDEEITRKYVSWIEDAKNFADIYNALDAFMVQNQKEDELELILEKKRLKPGIFSDALNEFEVTVNRIEQPKFKHYKDSYPRFVVYLGGRELPLILRIHNADIKNEAYVYGLNVYETLKNGLGGDLYFSSEVSSKGGVIVTSMSEKMLEVKPKDLNILAEKIGEILGDSIVSSAVVAGEHVGGIDFRQMNMLIQPMGSFSGLDFSPARLSGSALEAMDLDKGLENIKQMASSSMLPSPQRLKEYISACIFKGKIDEKADDFILSMLEVFQLQAEEGIESAALEREAVVMADTRSYVLPEKRLAVSNSHSLN